MRPSDADASEADATGAAQKFVTPASVDKPGKGKKLRAIRQGSSADVVVLLRGRVTEVEIATRFGKAVSIGFVPGMTTRKEM